MGFLRGDEVQVVTMETQRVSARARLLSLAAVLALGCGTRYGQVSSYWAIAAGPPTSQGASVSWSGIARPPAAGATLNPAEGTRLCFDATDLQAQFGAQCRDHEAEQPGAAEGEGRQVWWYCDHRTVVRVVVERCDGRGNFLRVVQLAVTLDHG